MLRAVLGVVVELARLQQIAKGPGAGLFGALKSFFGLLLGRENADGVIVYFFLLIDVTLLVSVFGDEVCASFFQQGERFAIVLQRVAVMSERYFRSADDLECIDDEALVALSAAGGEGNVQRRKRGLRTSALLIGAAELPEASGADCVRSDGLFC